jgi:inner membrane protein
VTALATVLLLDLVAAARPWPVPVVALLDEPAHLLTAWLVLGVLPRRTRPPRPWVLLGAVAIDVDHVPLYLWHVGTATENGRPVTHGLLTVLLLLAAALAVRRLRAPLTGLACGVTMHLVRDLATGPGVPLVWPLSPASVLVPYGPYAALLCVAAVATVATGSVAASARRGQAPRPSTRNHGREKDAHAQRAQSVPRR